MKFPSDLWTAYEQTTRHPTTSLKLHVKDALDDPERISTALLSAYRRPKTDPTPIQKGVKWPEGMLDDISAAAAAMHLNREQYVRLVLEWVVADFHNSHPNAGT